MLEVKMLSCEQQNAVIEGELFKTDEIISDLQQRLEEVKTEIKQSYNSKLINKILKLIINQ